MSVHKLVLWRATCDYGGPDCHQHIDRYGVTPEGAVDGTDWVVRSLPANTEPVAVCPACIRWRPWGMTPNQEEGL